MAFSVKIDICVVYRGFTNLQQGSHLLAALFFYPRIYGMICLSIMRRVIQMKKALRRFLPVLLIFLLTACGEIHGYEYPEPTTTPEVTDTATPTSTATPTPTSTPTPEPTDTWRL